jgi:hypothetical protein
MPRKHRFLLRPRSDGVFWNLVRRQWRGRPGRAPHVTCSAAWWYARSMRLRSSFVVAAGVLWGCGIGGSSDPDTPSQTDARARDEVSPVDASDGGVLGLADGSERSVVDAQTCPSPDAAGISIPLDSDAQACSSRPTLACPSGQSAAGQIAGLIEACHGAIEESALRVEFHDGCATAVFGGAAGPFDTACVERALDGQRWLCAVDLDCAGFGASTLR